MKQALRQRALPAPRGVPFRETLQAGFDGDGGADACPEAKSTEQEVILARLLMASSRQKRRSGELALESEEEERLQSRSQGSSETRPSPCKSSSTDVGVGSSEGVGVGNISDKRFGDSSVRSSNSQPVSQDSAGKQRPPLWESGVCW